MPPMRLLVYNAVFVRQPTAAQVPGGEPGGPGRSRRVPASCVMRKSLHVARRGSKFANLCCHLKNELYRTPKTEQFSDLRSFRRVVSLSKFRSIASSSCSSSVPFD